MDDGEVLPCIGGERPGSLLLVGPVELRVDLPLLGAAHQHVVAVEHRVAAAAVHRAVTDQPRSPDPPGHFSTHPGLGPQRGLPRFLVDGDGFANRLGADSTISRQVSCGGTVPTGLADGSGVVPHCRGNGRGRCWIELFGRDEPPRQYQSEGDSGILPATGDEVKRRWFRRSSHDIAVVCRRRMTKVARSQRRIAMNDPIQ